MRSAALRFHGSNKTFRSTHAAPVRATAGAPRSSSMSNPSPLSYLVAALALGAAASAQTTFVATGAGGTFPTSQLGLDGQYPHFNQTNPPSLPPNAFSTTVVVPTGATRLTSLVLRGLRHPWSGDAHFVLKDPAGQRFNVACPVNTWNSTIFGTGCDYGTTSGGLDYSFVDPSVAALDFPPTDVSTCNGPAGAYHLSGAYHQYFNNGNGAWPSSAPNNLGILNTPLHSIWVTPGVWTLECYDWYLASDNGTFTGWELRGDLGGAPVVYCTAGTTSSGCVPAIAASNQPSVSFANPCAITVANVEGQRSGLIFYGVDNTGFTPLSWAAGSGSFLCVKPPTQRSPGQSSGGSAGACNGQLQLDWNAFQSAFPGSLGAPWTVGELVYAQGWFRDPPAPKTTNLSDAILLTYQP
jgi:hypothetical protein